MLTIVLLPGGPGLSANTLADLNRLSEFCKVQAIELPRETDDWSYEGLLRFVKKQISGVSNLVLCGHSFGGIQAADIAVRQEIPIRGLICMSTPFSDQSFQAIGREFSRQMTPRLEESGQRFTDNPSNESFQAWLSNYEGIYFPEETVLRGAEMLARDQVEYRAYLGASDEGAGKEHLLDKLSGLPMPKLFLAGEVDQLFPVENAKTDANRGGFEFKSIGGAGHFVAFDRPNEVVDEIRLFLDGLSKSKRTEGK